MSVRKLCILLIIVISVAGCSAIREPPQSWNAVPQNQTAEAERYDGYFSENAANYTTLNLPNPLVRSPMPYYVHNTTPLNAYKYNVTVNNIRTAFSAWENATNGKVKFYEVFEKPEEGISIELVSDLANNTIGEAGPIYYPKKSYSLIVGGKMTIETVYGGSENRVLLLHEIGHIFGLGHSDNSHSILFPYNAYSQVMTDDILRTLDSLYQNVPAA